MNQHHFNDFTQRLQQWRNETEVQIKTLSLQICTNNGRVAELIDQSQPEHQRSMALLNHNRQRQLLKQIEAALHQPRNTNNFCIKKGRVA